MDNGRECVSDKPRSGRPQKLTEEDEKEIKELIDENDPKKHRINAMSYTTAELQEYFMKFHSKFIDEETFRAHLKKMGAHYIKAQLRYKEADQEKQLEFARNFCDLVTDHEFTKVLFINEMSVSTSAHNGYGWTFNQRLVVDVPQRTKNKGELFRCSRDFRWKSNRDRKEKHKSGFIHVAPEEGRDDMSRR